MKRTQPGPPAAWIWAGVAVLAVLLVSVLFWVVSIRSGAQAADADRTIPDVATMTYDRAAVLLQEADLVPKREDVTDDTIAAGNVVGTDPAAGTTVAKGQTVTILVSAGKETVRMPGVVGVDEQAARDAIAAAGLVVGTVTPVNDPQIGAGTVMAADTASGAVDSGDEIAVGTTVNLRVASGKVVLNDVTGYTVDAATRDLQAIGLAPITVEDPGCPASNPRTVSVMSVAPGEVAIRSEVTLTVCAG